MVFSHVGYQQALQRSPPTEPRATWSHAVPAGGPVRHTDWRRVALQLEHRTAAHEDAPTREARHLHSCRWARGTHRPRVP